MPQLNCLGAICSWSSRWRRSCCWRYCLLRAAVRLGCRCWSWAQCCWGSCWHLSCRWFDCCWCWGAAACWSTACCSESAERAAPAFSRSQRPAGCGAIPCLRPLFVRWETCPVVAKFCQCLAEIICYSFKSRGKPGSGEGRGALISWDAN